ncbi:MAG: divalent-cation tolerance protein CutA [Burkholderiales bacterium]
MTMPCSDPPAIVTDVTIVLTTVPDAACADRIARALVDERLAACVTALGPARSTYRWQGAVESAEELPLLIKTTADAWPALRERLRALHPYEVPEMLAWRAADGWPAYLDWVRGEVGPAVRPDASPRA